MLTDLKISQDVYNLSHAHRIGDEGEEVDVNLVKNSLELINFTPFETEEDTQRLIEQKAPED